MVWRFRVPIVQTRAVGANAGFLVWLDRYGRWHLGKFTCQKMKFCVDGSVTAHQVVLEMPFLGLGGAVADTQQAKLDSQASLTALMTTTQDRTSSFTT